MAGHTIVVGQLLRALADPNAAAQDGRTSLHRAAFHGWTPTVNLLLDNGADPAIKDSDGRTAADIARAHAIKELLAGFPAEKTQEAMEERRQKIASLPPKVTEVEDDKEEEPTKPAFAPKPRQTAKEAAAEKAAAAAKAAAENKAAKAAREAALSEADREERYRRAVAELKAELGEDKYGDETPLLPEGFTPPPVVVPRIAVEGAGHHRLNGTYRAAFACKDRVEFEKVGDRQCQIFWSEWHDEWRILMADFKLGSTLYRHRHKPNVKFDQCHGVPREDWQKWFGQEPIPTVRYLAEDEPDYQPEPEVGVPEVSGTDPTGAPTSPASPSAKQGQAFIELHPSLEFVAQVDDGAAARAEAAVAGVTGRKEVSLRAGGDGRIVETSEGLFGADEAPVEENKEDAAVTQARAWLEKSGEGAEVPPSFQAIQAAKAAAQELFNEGKVSDARQATTAAIRALRMLMMGKQEEELDTLLGVLYSNRSLLLTQQVTANDKEVLVFGADAAWRLVISDTDEALRVNPLNFKASFRRARALFELGELDEALADATKVVDHYARSSTTSNPEAAILREKILEAVKKDKGKWGDRGGPRWNRGGQSLVSELGGASKDISVEAARQKPMRTPWDYTGPVVTAPVARDAAASSSSRPLPAPKMGSDVEKALLSIAQGNAGRQLAYVKEHVSAEVIRKFFRKVPLGPDLLAAMVLVLADLAEEDLPAAADRLAAIASNRSSKTQCAMFDAAERAVFDGLLARVGPEAAAAWGDSTAGGDGGA
ncbi:unnamed protein product [Polarella glacialis]|uniref:Uncharacterized protein n=1 Tax=Polarella glacialis TaxID=89957 RepID=A0A813K3J5_POLGL|nr:unnamed protein product [Polarella glacialis]